jgi:hypothetical protein
VWSIAAFGRPGRFRNGSNFGFDTMDAQLKLSARRSRLGHIRLHGVRRLLIYCSTGLCHHSAVVDADRWPDETALRDLCPKAVCTKFGMIGADVRPNWQEREARESLLGKQWR